MQCACPSHQTALITPGSCDLCPAEQEEHNRTLELAMDMVDKQGAELSVLLQPKKQVKDTHRLLPRAAHCPSRLRHTAFCLVLPTAIYSLRQPPLCLVSLCAAALSERLLPALPGAAQQRRHLRLRHDLHLRNLRPRHRRGRPDRAGKHAHMTARSPHRRTHPQQRAHTQQRAAGSVSWAASRTESSPFGGFSLVYVTICVLTVQ